MSEYQYVAPPDFTPGLYRHYKGGLYNALMLALHTETEEWLVVYVALESGNVTARPLSMWSERVQTESGAVPRFEKVNSP